MHILTGKYRTFINKLNTLDMLRTDVHYGGGYKEEGKGDSSDFSIFSLRKTVTNRGWCRSVYGGFGLGVQYKLIHKTCTPTVVYK